MPHAPQDNEAPVAQTGLLQESAALVRFLSRIPLPSLAQWDRLDVPPDFRRAARSIPLAGLVINLPSVVVLLLLAPSALPSSIVALLAIGTCVAVQGCLHEDGLADVFDGFFGGHTPKRRLEIMKDSRIGAFGAGALILSLSLRWLLLGAALERFGTAGAVAAFLFAESCGRLGMTWLWHKMPPAYHGGLTTRYGIPRLGAALQASLFIGIIGLFCLLALPFLPVALGCLISALVIWGTSQISLVKIKGVTGDVLGATQQIGSIGFFLGLLLL